MDYKRFFRKQAILIVVVLMLLVVVASGVTYAVFQRIYSNASNQVVVSGTLETTYTSGSNILGDFLPMNKSEGMLEVGYSFTVKNIGTLPASYVIKLFNNPDGDINNYLAHENLYISFDNGTPQYISTLLKENDSVVVENDVVYIILQNGTLEVDEERNHNIKVWLRADADPEVIGKQVDMMVEVETTVLESCTDIGITNFKDCIVASNELNEGNPDFSKISSNKDSGLWGYPEYSGTSYYFRGTKELLNNNVIFAEHQWKIVRIDYQGNIKLIYNGTCPLNECEINDSGEETAIGKSKFNELHDDEKYVGYTYDDSGTEKNSAIKLANETWYRNNLLTYDSYIEDVTYCNETTSRIYTHLTYYLTNDRITPAGEYSVVTPSLSCIKSEDKYRKSNITGNGLLGEKIGLLTADEAMLAGGSRYNGNDKFYLYVGLRFWTMNPYLYHAIEKEAFGMIVDMSGNVTGRGLINTEYLRPVIALNSNVKITSGTGSVTNPYVIE